jgi:DNA-binding transcriptional LysR family regulator
VPTAAALAIVDAARRMEDAALALGRGLATARSLTRGVVRVTTSQVAATWLLPEVLARLQREHAGIEIELVASNELTNLLRREADIAVRMVRPAQDALVARRVGGIEMGLYAHQRYLADHGTPRNVAQLRRHALIGYDTETAFIRQMQKRYPAFTRGTLAFRADSDLANLAALRAGYGVGICHVALGKRDPSLVRVLAKEFAPVLDTWIAMHEDLRESPRCAVTFAALVAGFKGYIAGS